MKTIAEEWEEFAEMIFAKTKPVPGQFEEMKKAFFAGAWSVLCMCKRIGEPDVSEDEGVCILEDRQREGEEFYKDLIRNYAEGN